mgnify:CR=1 FL=1
MVHKCLDQDTLQEVQDTLKKFATKHLPREKRLEWDRKDFFPEELVRKMVSPEVGLHLLFLPEEYGGLGGGAYDIYRVSEEMAKIDLGMATAFLAISLGTDPLRVGGTQEQKQKWMTRIAEEGLIVAYGATEPGAGSDLAALKTQAEPVYDAEKKLAYRLNGVKQFITNGGVADIYSILAVAPQGPSFFIVEKGMQGLSHGKQEEKHGIRLSNTTQVILDNVLVPAENLVGMKEGEGISQAVSVFGYTRLMVAAFGLGAGESALQYAIDYGKQRMQFGKPLLEMQGYTHKLLVPHAIHLEAARYYIEETAKRLDGGETGLETEGAIAKLFATETGNQAAEAAIQAHGGYGYTHEYEVEKIKRDVRITMIYEGTSEIMQQTIGKNRWSKFLQTKGAYYTKIAEEMDQIAREDENCGASSLSKAIHTLVAAMEYIREKRLTREQYVLFQMADMITAVETSSALCRKAFELKKIPSSHVDYVRAAAKVYAAEVLSNLTKNVSFYLTAFGTNTLSEIQRLNRICNFEESTRCYDGIGDAMNQMILVTASV